MTPSRACAHSSRPRSAGRSPRWAAWLGASLAAGCASAPLPPPARVVERAKAAATYSASLRVSLKGPQFRGRTRVLLGFRRPASLRIEIPGPAGPRLVAVTKDGALAAVFPAARAIFRGRADAADLDALLGVGLAPEELIDLLVGVASPRLRSYQARWGAALPREIRAVLPDGSRLRATVDEAEADLSLRDEAFATPGHEGFREVDAAEARRLWGGR